jgi:hypothetical protein
MRRRLIALVCAVALLAAAAVALGSRRDPLAGIHPVAPATESGRARDFDVRRIATGLNGSSCCAAAVARRRWT